MVVAVVVSSMFIFSQLMLVYELFVLCFIHALSSFLYKSVYMQILNEK